MVAGRDVTKRLLLGNLLQYTLKVQRDGYDDDFGDAAKKCAKPNVRILRRPALCV